MIKSPISHLPPHKEKNLRHGHFTPEEIDYCTAAIEYYKRGHLDAFEGQSLRKYLAEKLNCGMLRVSKRFPCTMDYNSFSPAESNSSHDDDDIEKEIRFSRVRI